VLLSTTPAATTDQRGSYLSAGYRNILEEGGMYFGLYYSKAVSDVSPDDFGRIPVQSISG
jgi:hypothetical protein